MVWNRATKPEFELLCCLVRPQPDHKRALELARKGLDLASVMRMAASHGVRPHLLNALKNSVCADELNQLQQALQVFQTTHMVRNLLMTRELLRIANSLDQHGIRFATFKGTTLAVSLYGDISRREANDIDIIVPANSLEAAEFALQACGYHAALGSSRKWRETFLGYQRQYMFVSPDSMLAIDLHWGFAQEGFPFPALDVWNTLKNVTIAGRAMPTFGAETLAVYLAGHGAKEGWKSLGWVCDFAELYHRHSEIDWINVLLRLDRNGCRQVLFGLSLINELLGVPVRDELLKHAQRDSKIRALVELTVRRASSLGETKNPHPEMELTVLEVCDAWFDRIRVLWLLITTRTTGDYKALPLPRPLWRLYHLIRPFRLALKLLLILVPMPRSGRVKVVTDPAISPPCTPIRQAKGESPWPSNYRRW